MPRAGSLFLSDIHLGTRACQAERLLDFLRIQRRTDLPDRRSLSISGDFAYDQVVRLNLILSWLRRKAGVAGYWSLAGRLAALYGRLLDPKIPPAGPSTAALRI